MSTRTGFEDDLRVATVPGICVDIPRVHEVAIGGDQRADNVVFMEVATSFLDEGATIVPDRVEVPNGDFHSLLSLFSRGALVDTVRLLL